jgi:uncharacterized protein YlxW (UPF0749 family)
MLKLLGVGKFLKDFFLANWKWLVPLILLVAGFLWTKSHYYDLGQDDERLVWEQRLEDERKKNEELTNKLASSVQTFAETVNNRNDSRVEKETIRENRISTIVEEKPIYQQCLVDQEVINEQNALKAMGPK